MLVPSWIRRRTLRKSFITENAHKNKEYLNHLYLYITFGRRVRILKEGYQGWSLTTDIRPQFGMVPRERFHCSGSFGLV